MMRLGVAAALLCLPAGCGTADPSASEGTTDSAITDDPADDTADDTADATLDDTALDDTALDDSAAASAALFEAIGPDGPGCSAAVNVDGEIAWSAAYGLASIDRGEPLTTGTIVDIGSASKQFTATAIGLLIADGALAWDDPVGDHLDDLPGWSARVTVDDLVHHTSGIPDYIDLLDGLGVDLLEPSTQEDAIESLDGTDLEFEPGSRFEYSNSNYLLMAEVVRAVSGDDLATHLATHVFSPLGLDAEMAPGASSTDESASEGRAHSYEDEGGDWVRADSPWTQVGDGAVQTTPEQLALWGTQYWDSELPDGLDELLMDRSTDMGDDGRYGLGIMEYAAPSGDGTVLTHSGGWSGFDTGFVLDPARRTAVAVTCNTPDGPVTGEVADDLLLIWAP